MLDLVVRNARLPEPGKGPRLVDIGFRERTAAAELVEGIAETFLQTVEHPNSQARTPQGAHLRCLGAIPGRARDRKGLKSLRMAGALVFWPG